MLSDVITRAAFVDAIDGVAAMLVVDADSGEILYATRPLEEMFGYEMRNELVGEKVEILVPERMREGHVGLRQSYASHPEPRPMGRVGCVRGRKKDGTEFPVLISLAAAKIVTWRCVIVMILDMSAVAGFSGENGT